MAVLTVRDKLGSKEDLSNEMMQYKYPVVKELTGVAKPNFNKLVIIIDGSESTWGNESDRQCRRMTADTEVLKTKMIILA